MIKMSDNMEANILKMINELVEGEELSISIDQTFEEIGIDSFLFLNLVIQCEEYFGIKIEDEMLLTERYANVEAFIDFIQNKCNL